MIMIKRGDITKENVDAIVNAANTGLKGGGGVDGAIHRAAGPQVMVECRAIGHCPTGTAVITGGGNLPAKKIIHTAGPVWNGGSRREPELLRDCYAASFKLAQAYGLQTIAFPAISTGVYGYPKREAATIALNVGIQFEKNFDEIRYLCFSAEDLQIYQDIYAVLRKQPGVDCTRND